MSKVTGVIERAHTNERGISSILVNGTWYGTYKTPHKDKEGQHVEFDAEQNGKYWNAKNVEVAAAPPAAAGGGGSVMTGDARQQSIVLQSSYKTASEILVGMLAQGIAPLPAKKGDQFDTVLGLLDDIALRLYNNCINASEFVEVAVAPGPTEDYNPVEA